MADNGETSKTLVQLSADAFSFDDAPDIDTYDALNLADAERLAIQEQITQLKNKLIVTPNRHQTEFEKKQLVITSQIDVYDDTICKHFNNQFSFLPVEQSISSSKIAEIMRTLRKNPEFNRSQTADAEVLIRAYLELLDARYSLFKHTLLQPNDVNPHYGNNLLALDRAYVGTGYSIVKLSYLTPFHVLELFSGRNIRKHHLAALLDDLIADRLPSVAQSDEIVQL
ncbi:hypothetical protein AU074_13825 [Pseudomonas sp. ATCC PTA-122608]|uniref:hypothetical protein n=1 Tax=Pseudomonas sp. ATCC PTA-122608 TaxID=1771311 RepID=UPI00096B8C75|nr:hypothetical protein [Pseudomonas sp. ATCC PTA-122608]OLY72249.1 hypothetical protein AU074_13825 [Pseudomonas sp. ATCC PTA-122608]